MMFEVLNRQRAAVYDYAGPHIVISVTDPKSSPVKLPVREGCREILPLQFYDLDWVVDLPPYYTEGVDTPLFTPQLAAVVVDFFESHRDLVDATIVHCEAGISRSAGVAAALSKIHNNHDSYFFKRFIPNRRVYSMILAEYFGRVGARASG